MVTSLWGLGPFVLGLGPGACVLSCPVCFGGDDIAVRESLNAGIGILLGVTAVVLAAFLRFFIRLARRSREYAHLVDTPQASRPAFAETSQGALGTPTPQPNQGGAI